MDFAWRLFALLPLATRVSFVLNSICLALHVYDLLSCMDLWFELELGL
jgi:hypothetical protein